MEQHVWTIYGIQFFMVQKKIPVFCVQVSIFSSINSEFVKLKGVSPALRCFDHFPFKNCKDVYMWILNIKFEIESWIQ